MIATNERTIRHMAMHEKAYCSCVTAFSHILKNILLLPCSAKKALLLAYDVFAAFVTVWFAILASTEFWYMSIPDGWLLYLIAPGLMFPLFFMAGIYRAVSRYTGFAAMAAMLRATALYGAVFYLVIQNLNLRGLSHAIGIVQPMMLLLVIGGGRAMVRYWFISPKLVSQGSSTEIRLLIYGAGQAGTDIARILQQSGRYKISGFLDDDHDLHGRTINGIPVFDSGNADTLIRELRIRSILVAMPSVSRSRRTEIVRHFRKYDVSIKTLPGIAEIADGKVRISDIKEVEIEDLLGRDPVPENQELLESAISGKVVMVTGAGGSIGSELCRQILSAKPLKLLLVDNSEYNLYTIHAELERSMGQSDAVTHIVPILCDVTNACRMNDLFRVFMPSAVYHVAAYKHVPMVEYNPAEGVRNNVFGTLNVVESAIRFKTLSVVLVSTDKAVRPTNVMGASKRVCEMILQAYAAEGNHSTCFSMVRFGNVLGSSGSVVPLFRRQIHEGGPITITNEKITRYFMTIPEAAQLVIQAGAMAVGGEVYLLDMGTPVRIIDLARRMVLLSGLSVRDADNPDGDIEISITGLRPGEKLYEELLIGNNSVPTENPRIYKANEHFITLVKLTANLKLLSEAISNNNVTAIKQQLKNMVCEYTPAASSVDSLCAGEINGDLPKVKSDDYLRFEYERKKINGKWTVMKNIDMVSSK